MPEKEIKEPEKLKIDIRRISTGEINVRNKEDVFRDLENLKHSIKHFGLLQNIVVTNYKGKESKNYDYELVAGQRRLEAFKQLFEETGDPKYATIDAEYFKDLGKTTSIILSFEENETRTDLTYDDKKNAFETLFKEYGSIKEVANVTHRSIFEKWLSKIVDTNLYIVLGDYKNGAG